MENRITTLFGIRYPIIAGGMIWCSGWRLAAAVSDAGGLGLIGAGSMTPDLLREHIRKCRAATGKPFGVNVPLMYCYAEQIMQVVMEERVPAVFTSAGSPKTWTGQLHAAGCKVAHVVSSTKFALKCQEAGVDAVVAEGFEAGGHNGRERIAKSLVENIMDSADAAIASGTNSATFRFGHDGNVIPLVGLLRLENCYNEESDPAKFYQAWCNFKMVPMAANVQIVFFRADRQWWELYTDTTLQALIERTLEYNKDMKIAAARVKELAAMKRIDFANLFPQVSGKLYADKEAENYGGDNYDSDRSYEAKAIVSWEVDLWGNLRWAKDKSMADFLGSIEAQRALKMSLVAEVAQAYFELVALDNELAIVRQTLNARKEGVRLAKLRFEGGLTSETSYQQAQVEFARTATLVPDLERKISIKENDIAFLAGEYPRKIERSVLPEEVKLPENLPVGLPSTLLERRPDVRQAEQKLYTGNANLVSYRYQPIFASRACFALRLCSNTPLEAISIISGKICTAFAFAFAFIPLNFFV